MTGAGAEDISPRKAAKMMIAIEYKPTPDGLGTFNIIVGGSVNQNDLKRIKAALKVNLPEGHTLGRVVATD